MGQYLIDNNVISNYLSNLFSISGMAFIADVFDEVPNISVITEIEALSWISTDKVKEKIIKEFVLDANVLSLSPAIVSQSIAIKRSRKIKMPDAIIAATAIIHNLILLTSDMGFANISGLEIINPVDL